MKRIIYILLLKIIVTGSLYSQEILHSFRMSGYDTQLSIKNKIPIGENGDYYQIFGSWSDSIYLNGYIYHSPFHSEYLVWETLKNGFIVLDKSFEIKDIVECQNCVIRDVNSKGNYYYLFIKSIEPQDIYISKDTLKVDSTDLRDSQYVVLLDKDTGKIVYKLKIKYSVAATVSELELLGEDIIIASEFGHRGFEIHGKYIENLGQNSSVYVARLDWRQDSIKWIKRVASFGRERLRDLKIDSDENVIIEGYTDTDLFLIEEKKHRLNYDNFPSYLIKFGSDGTTKYVQSGMENTYGVFYKISISSEDEVYVSGYTKKDFVLPDTVYDFEENGYARGTILKFDKEGELEWGYMQHSTLFSFAHNVVSKQHGDLMVCSGFGGEMEVNGKVYKPENDYKVDNYMMRMTAEGKITFVKLFESLGNSILEGLAINDKDNLLIQVKSFRGKNLKVFDKEYTRKGAANLAQDQMLLVEIDRSFLVGTQETEGVKEYGFELLSNVLQSGTPIGIEFTPSMNEEEFSIQLVNSSGQIQKVIKKEKGIQKLYVETTGLSTGIHFVILRTKQGTFFRKVVIL